MKIYLLILACLLLSCANTKEEMAEDILSQSKFEAILKDIHLEEAMLELNKKIGDNKFKTSNSNIYFQIYDKHKVSETKFKSSLYYYSDNPERLEQVYTNILNELAREKSTYDLE